MDVVFGLHTCWSCCGSVGFGPRYLALTGAALPRGALLSGEEFDRRRLLVCEQLYAAKSFKASFKVIDSGTSVTSQQAASGLCTGLSDCTRPLGRGLLLLLLERLLLDSVRSALRGCVLSGATPGSLACLRFLCFLFARILLCSAKAGSRAH